MEFDATFIIATVSFILFVLIMNKIFYAPILKIMQERQSLVEQNYNSAKATKLETEKQTEFRNSELEKSREEARNVISENAQILKNQRSEKINEYKDELYGNVAKERDSLKQSAIEAKETLKDNVVDIAKEISEKILGTSVSTQTIDKSQIKEQG